MNMTKRAATEIVMRQKEGCFIPELWAKHAAKAMADAIDKSILEAMLYADTVPWGSRVPDDEENVMRATFFHCQACIFGDQNEIHS